MTTSGEVVAKDVPPVVQDVASSPGPRMVVGIEAVVLAKIAEITGLSSADITPKITASQVNKFTLTNATFELDQPYPGADDLVVIAMFTNALSSSASGDIRIYVGAKAAKSDIESAVGGPFRCYTIHRANLSVVRESFRLLAFVDALAFEWISLFDLEGPDEGDEDTNEGDEELGCDGVDGCGSEIVWACECQACMGSEEGSVLACETHRPQADRIHLRRRGRPAKWLKNAPVEDLS
jgi:hypothetical protein